jgi:hypothetical protein
MVVKLERSDIISRRKLCVVREIDSFFYKGLTKQSLAQMRRVISGDDHESSAEADQTSWYGILRQLPFLRKRCQSRIASLTGVEVSDDGVRAEARLPPRSAAGAGEPEELPRPRRV